MFNTPSEALEKAIEISKVKASLPWKKSFLLALLAGMYIAFAGHAATTGSCNLLSDWTTYGLGKILSGCIFPAGLILVVLCGSELFTGNCLMVTGYLDKQISLKSMLKNWGVVYLGNFVGALLFDILLYYSGVLNGGNGIVSTVSINIAVAKAHLPIFKAFILGFLCNVLVCLAVWMSYVAKTVIGKIAGIFFPIMVFVTSGFEHSIANMYYVPIGILSSCSVLWSDFFINNLIPVTIGNLVGGIFISSIYWWCYKK